jgi:predicted exporter
MLTVSETPAVRAFGLTVLIGVAGAALLAPLIVDMNKALKR